MQSVKQPHVLGDGVGLERDLRRSRSGLDDLETSAPDSDESARADESGDVDVARSGLDQLPSTEAASGLEQVLDPRWERERTPHTGEGGVGIRRRPRSGTVGVADTAGQRWTNPAERPPGVCAEWL